MPTRAQLQQLVASGAGYGEIAAKYGMSAGRVYMIVTGLPADGSGVRGPEFLADRVGVLDGSSQHLANPPTEVATESENVRNWLRERAGRDSAMQHAGAARTFEPPPVNDDDSTDVINVLGQQHNQVKYLLEQLEALPSDAVDDKQQLLGMVRERLEPHERAEQKYLWPAVREGLPGGDALADHGEEQEREADELLKQDDVDVGELSTALGKHVAFEDYVFLQVKEHISEGERSNLGKRIRKALDG